MLSKIKATGKSIRIGGILSDYEIHGPDMKKLIYDRCRYILNKPKRAKARKDFGHFILSLPENPISPDVFNKELKKQKIKKLDPDLVQGVLNLFMNKNNEIKCQELVQDYMKYYPDTKLPPPKPKKAKKGGKGKKGKKNKEKDSEKEVQVHDLDSQGTGSHEPPQKRESVPTETSAPTEASAVTRSSAASERSNVTESSVATEKSAAQVSNVTADGAASIVTAMSDATAKTQESELIIPIELP